MTHVGLAQSTRRYQIGDTIPGRGVVSRVWASAYEVCQPTDDHGWRQFHVVPFYGPNGVDGLAPVEGLVTFADGSRYGGAR